MKIKHKKRNKKLELEMRDKICDIVRDPKYAELPMLAMSHLVVEENNSDALIDISEEDYCFLFSGCLFKGVEELKKEVK